MTHLQRSIYIALLTMLVLASGCASSSSIKAAKGLRNGCEETGGTWGVLDFANYDKNYGHIPTDTDISGLAASRGRRSAPVLQGVFLFEVMSHAAGRPSR